MHVWVGIPFDVGALSLHLWWALVRVFLFHVIVTQAVWGVWRGGVKYPADGPECGIVDSICLACCPASLFYSFFFS